MGTISCETFSQTQTPPFPNPPPPLPSPTHPHHYPSRILSDKLLLREINGDGRWWWPGHPLSHPCMGWTYRWGSRRGEGGHWCRGSFCQHWERVNIEESWVSSLDRGKKISMSWKALLTENCFNTKQEIEIVSCGLKKLKYFHNLNCFLSLAIKEL